MNGSDIAIEILDEAGWSKVVHIHPLVYPPDNPITKVWAGVQWADADHRFVLSRRGEPVSHVALHVREGLANGRPVRIAGIGGVMTHPAMQGNGYAQRLLRAALDKAVELHAGFCLLICEEKNVGFYEKQGWRVFPGTMIYQQDGKSLQWTLSKVMVRDQGRRAPRGGMIDLRGLPW
ncbi:MAG: GNAT family N-acetyltransferase [Reyranellaceae bacterium]